MNSEQAAKVLSKMVNVQHFEQYLVKQYNQCVVDLLLNGNNTFSLDLYLKLANSPMNSGDITHKMAMQFCLENIEVNTNTDTVDYIPTPIDGYPYWAIDADGRPFYYSIEPVLDLEFGVNEWRYTYPYSSTLPGRQDYNFDKEKYRHMYVGEKWKNSLFHFETNIVDYIPEPIRNYSYWAIDANGDASYYSEKPLIEDTNFHEWLFNTNANHIYNSNVDYNFDKVKFRHMYYGDNWKNSLVCFEQKKYQPEPIEGYTHWAIDSDGQAFYYNFKPKSNNDEWVMSYNPSINDCQKDDDFDSEMYRHQWQGNNWKNSLIEF